MELPPGGIVIQAPYQHNPGQVRILIPVPAVLTIYDGERLVDVYRVERAALGVPTDHYAFRE
jgi:hypothetical protein